MPRITNEKISRRRYLKYAGATAIALALVYGLKDLPKILARTSYKIEIDRETCQACGACYGLDPIHFEGETNRKAKVAGGTSNSKSTGNFYDDKITDVKNIATSCPSFSIKVTKT